MTTHIITQSRKFIKPSVPTPPSLRHYKIGFTDEFAPVINVSIVLFFSLNGDNNPKFVARLEKSLEKMLTRFYPFAGRYVEEIHTVDCDDQGVEFIQAKVNIKLQDFLDCSHVNVKLVDEFIPSKMGSADEVTAPLLSTKLTSFDCGGVALGVSVPHRIADASTLSTFLIEWAATSKEENKVEFIGSGFNSTSLFPARGLPSLQLGLPTSISDDNKIVTMKLSFSKDMLSSFKEKVMLNGSRNDVPGWSKVQLVSALVLKALIGVDRAIHDPPRDCILLQPINLREKTASIIPKDSCGNLWGLLATEFGIAEATEDLADTLRDSIKKTIINYSKVRHDSEEGQTLVLNSFSQMANFSPTANVIWLTSWCNFCFYEADFGFGKPIWASSGTLPIKNSIYLMDDVEGNGVEAYVCLEVKDVRHFEEALDIKAFAS